MWSMDCASCVTLFVFRIERDDVGDIQILLFFFIIVLRFETCLISCVIIFVIRFSSFFVAFQFGVLLGGTTMFSQAPIGESDYPYIARDGSCKTSFTAVIPRGGVTGNKSVCSRSATVCDMKSAIMQ